MNKIELLKVAKANGFADENPTLDSVKKFFADIDLTDQNGVVVDVEKAWNTKAIIQTETTVQTGKRMTAAEAKAVSVRTASVTEGTDNQPQRFNIGNVAKSVFKAKAARGQTSIKDADAAEILGAISRINYMKSIGEESWSNKASDIDCAKAIVTYDNAAGGYLVPPAEFMSELIYNGEPTGVARKIAGVVKMGSAKTTYPRETADVTLPAAVEGAALTEITPAGDAVELVPRLAGGYFVVTNTMMEDSAVNIGEMIGRKSMIAMDNRYDDDYFLGDGTNTYNKFVGLKNSTKISSQNASGAAWSNVTYSDVMNAIGKLQGVNTGNIQIVTSRQAAIQILANLNIATSQFKNVFTLNGDKTGGDFLGFPVIFSQRLPIASASASKFLFVGDFRNGSMIGERRDLTIKPDVSSGLINDGVRFYVTARYSVNICGHGRTDLTNQNIVALTTT